jgi:hypothetical protein
MTPRRPFRLTAPVPLVRNIREACARALDALLVSVAPIIEHAQLHAGTAPRGLRRRRDEENRYAEPNRASQQVSARIRRARR